MKLEGELDGAGASDLVERIETAVRPAGAKAARERLCGLAEEGTCKCADRIAEVGMIEEVEEFRAETKPDLLGEVKLPLQAEIYLGSPETAQHVASEITLLPLGGATPCPDLV